MSAVGLDTVEKLELESTNISYTTYLKDLTANRVYFVLGVPQIAAEALVKGFQGVFKGVEITGIAMKCLRSTLGVPQFAAEAVVRSLELTGSAVQCFSGVLNKIVSTEAISFFAQDVLELPNQVNNFASRTVEWWSGSIGLETFAHQGRKLVGHLGTTLGDYADTCKVFKVLRENINYELDLATPAANIFGKTITWGQFGRIGNVGSAIGAMSRITDYVMGDGEEKIKHTLTPQLEKVRAPIAESKAMWKLAQDVSVLALSVLCFTFGFAALPGPLSVGLPAAILAARMVDHFRGMQLKAIDASYAQMQATKKLLKA